MVDGKEPSKVTNWENWLSFYAPGALISLSQRAPLPIPRPGAPCLFDYAPLERFRRKRTADDESLDPARLLKNFKFKADQQPGLEFADVLANSIRRMLRGELEREGWANIYRLMTHRSETYIKFIFLDRDRTSSKVVIMQRP